MRDSNAAMRKYTDGVSAEAAGGPNQQRARLDVSLANSMVLAIFLNHGFTELAATADAA